MNSIFLYILGVNVVTFFLMRMDKQKAIKQQYRIPERTFWALAILGGAIGAYFGMKTFHHKTKHTSFVIGMPILILVHLFLVGYYFMSI